MGGAASYKLVFDLCLHIVMVTGKCTDFLRGIVFGLGGRFEGEGLRGRISPWRNLEMEMEKWKVFSTENKEQH